MIKAAYYEFVPKGELVFEYKSPSIEFFVILKGRVSIHYSTKSDPNPQQQKKHETSEAEGSKSKVSR